MESIESSSAVANRRRPSALAIQFPANCNYGGFLHRKWYAIAVGRLGIYDTWEKTKVQVERFNQAHHKSFLTRDKAVAWIVQQFGGIAPCSLHGVDGHRDNVMFEGTDQLGHAMYTCHCCDKVYCTNRRP